MPAFTLKEAASELRISVRSLQDIVKRHPFYYPNGNRKLFTEENLSSIRGALLEERLDNESARNLPVRAGPSASTAYKRALKLLSQKKKRTGRKQARE